MKVEIEMAGLNEFELQRARLIARNRARLMALGIPEAVSGLSKLAPAAAAPKPKKPRAPKPAAAQPSRQSSRLRDQQMIARGEVPPDVEPGSELAMFIIDGECPRCGKVLSVGHARHLDNCQGPPEPPTEEEIAAQAEAYKSQQKDKLRQLELGGLVDYVPGGSSRYDGAAEQAAETSEAAAEVEPPAKRKRGPAAAAEPVAAEGEEQQQKGRGRKQKKSVAAAAAKPPEAAAAGSPEESYATFIVIGSTGNHYVVKLTDSRRSCTCMDHRIRRRDCKHIRLIWEQLSITDKPQEWKQAVEQQLADLASADEGDVEMVHQAEQRRKARAGKQAAAATSTSTAAMKGRRV